MGNSVKRLIQKKKIESKKEAQNRTICPLFYSLYFFLVTLEALGGEDPRAWPPSLSISVTTA